MKTPVIQWGLIVAIVTLGAGGFIKFNVVENQVQANQLQIGFEQTMRVVGQEQIEKDLGELKEEISEVKRVLEEGQNDTNELLRELVDRLPIQ